MHKSAKFRLRREARHRLLSASPPGLHRPRHSSFECRSTVRLQKGILKLDTRKLATHKTAAQPLDCLNSEKGQAISEGRPPDHFSRNSTARNPHPAFAVGSSSNAFSKSCSWARTSVNKAVASASEEACTVCSPRESDSQLHFWLRTSPAVIEFNAIN